MVSYIIRLCVFVLGEAPAEHHSTAAIPICTVFYASVTSGTSVTTQDQPRALGAAHPLVSLLFLFRAVGATGGKRQRWQWHVEKNIYVEVDITEGANKKRKLFLAIRSEDPGIGQMLKNTVAIVHQAPTLEVSVS